MCAQGKVQAVHHKRNLPNYGVFDEKRYFRPGRIRNIILVNGVSVGINICEDIWTSDGVARVQARSGAAVIVNISASPYQIGKIEQRKQMLRRRAIGNRVIMAFSNLIGGQDELVFDGCSMIIDHTGQLLAQGKAFEEDLIVADLDVKSVLEARKEMMRSHGLEQTHHMPTVMRIVCSMEPSVGKRARLSPSMGEALTIVEEAYRALRLGIRDYAYKNDFAKAVIGLSGGIDSALTAALAVDALGKNRVVGVFMPSRYTSRASCEAVDSLVRNLGITLKTISIEDAYTAFLTMLAGEFCQMEPDTTEENVQARIRGDVLMALSNKFGWLVLSTGNKSEMSVGYATLYGDMAGGLSVLKDVPKTMVYRLARFRNAMSSNDVIPEGVLQRAPTAELRADQMDQDSLPPYDVLDPIVEAYVERNAAVDHIAAMGFDVSTVEWVRRMVDRHEYKRRQSPIGIKITPRAFGKDWRMPVTNRYQRI